MQDEQVLKKNERDGSEPALKKLADSECGRYTGGVEAGQEGRNVLHALLMFQQLQEKGINFRSITDGVDLKTASGAITFVTSFPQHNMNLILIANVP
ncbi:hypothetical protein BANRA_05498 [Escherichia coli]|nr:hypothetical protein [Escherichia coli]VCW49762.1 hypothetical protein BANRA_05498 [Escherichia coli]